MTGWWLKVDNGRPDHPKWSVLTGDEYKFADRLLCWAARHETAFVPEGTVVSLAGGDARLAKRRMKALCEGAASAAGKEHGIFERAPGGFVVHDAEKYWPPGAADRRDALEDLRAKRAAAGRVGGRRSATVRASAYGSAQPKQTPKQNTGPPEANPEANPKQNPEATSKQTEAKGRFSPHTPLSGRNTENGKTAEVVASWQVFARAQGERPRLHPPLLPVKKMASECTPNDAFREYAIDLGLAPRDYDDVLADWRDKCGDKPRTQEWLASMLCRFIEQKASKQQRRSDSFESGHDEPLVVDDEGRLVS